MNAKLVFENVAIYEFDQTGRLLETLVAKTAVDTGEGHWRLKNGVSTVYESATPATPNVRATPSNRIEERRFDMHLWPTEITTSTVSVALLDPDNLTTVELYQYVSHLDQNQQSTQRYEVEFWRKLFYPLGCLVMVVLALPFAYLHFRSEGTAGYVFLGFLVGIRRLIDEVRADMDDIRQELRSTKKFLDLPNVTRKIDGSSKFKIR